VFDSVGDVLNAIAVSVVLLAASLIAATPSLSQGTSWQSEIEMDGWTRCCGDESGVILIRDAVTPPGSNYKRLWVRIEWAPELENVEAFGLSTRSLEEIDCSQYRSRVLSRSGYPERNLSGTQLYSFDRVAEWRYVAPLINGEYITNTVC
jgi:hypothetical protein